MELRDRNLGTDENPVLALGPLEVTSDLVQLVQAAALGIGDEQLDLRQGVFEGGLDRRAQLLEADAGEGGDENGAGMAEKGLGPLVLAEQVGLVEHEQPWLAA